MTLTHTSRPSEQGFTLVELAIVMVIIGILIGGILKGQELIANARISGTVGQLKGLGAAMNTFQDKYGVLPGLMPDATARLPGCVTPCANATVGTTRYGANLNAPASVAAPGAQVFLHLNASDLISGIDPAGGSLTFGKVLPVVRSGGGMWVASAASATDSGFSALQTGQPYAVLNGSVANVGATTGAMTPTTVAQIDRKMDDGQPNAGTVQVVGTGCTTGNTATSPYNEVNTGAACATASRAF